MAGNQLYSSLKAGIEATVHGTCDQYEERAGNGWCMCLVLVCANYDDDI